MTYEYEVIENMGVMPEIPWAYVHTNSISGDQRVYVRNTNGKYYKVGFSESFTKAELDKSHNTYPLYGKEAVILRVK